MCSYLQYILILSHYCTDDTKRRIRHDFKDVVGKLFQYIYIFVLTRIISLDRKLFYSMSLKLFTNPKKYVTNIPYVMKKKTFLPYFFNF